MGGDIPALRRGLRVLDLLAQRPHPVPAALIARELGLPRSSTYQLLNELRKAGYVTYLDAERKYGLGLAAFELGSAYLRHDPLERVAAPLLRGLVDTVGGTGHLGILHGRESLYLIEQRPARPQTLVTDVGVRLPAQLTATGRAMLARLDPAHVRALFPGPAAFPMRTARGPRDLRGLRRLLKTERERGWAVEDGYVTAGFATVAAAVFDHGGRPIAAIGLTLRHHCPDGSGESSQAPDESAECGQIWPEIAAPVRATAAALTATIGGRPPTPTGRPHRIT
ncbi:IclR family transcriptional regulator [Nocardia seriolae]|uniref:HTH-type transcriptional repressor AllR n=1 Tax=Nocardia seriolae TaxID=37332 RepID=A0ABC9YYY7_9NOCA|nr:IclR family transcriptional regulator [Nocardia seriolae]APA96844.1 HTH-type transcriptional repressor AllR [Nocardia seriolae]OJF82024.1 IclR family transcriptional regulator [Nocardia seriolae]PSK28877.1 IclR family transcriptional regulator [Nocardia seriolae]QOW33889.1 IclR family transcriptional regulator [Nocardia seriolae]QUN18617.1 IclR family transcriptional regulator [Nocardia seriolae]